VVDGVGKRIDIRYDVESSDSSGNPHKTYTSGPCVPDVHAATRCLTRVGPVVSRYAVTVDSKSDYPNGFGMRFDYRYEDARVGLFGRGWLGFRKTIIEQSENNWPTGDLIERTTITRDNTTFDPITRLFPLAGLEVQRVTETAAAQSSVERAPVARQVITDQQWSIKRVNGAARFAFLSFRYQQTGDRHLNGEFVPTSTVTTYVSPYAVDEFGNVLSAQTATYTGDETQSIETTTTEYDNARNGSRVADWLINIPLEQTVRELAADGTSKSRTVAWEHDELGLLTAVIREPNEPSDVSRQLLTTFERGTDLFRNVRSRVATGYWTSAGTIQTGTRVTSFQYDDQGIYPRRTIRHVGDHCPVDFALDDRTEVDFGASCLIDDFKFDTRDGTKLGRVDPGGVGVQASFDAFGRLLRQVSPTEALSFQYADDEPTYSDSGGWLLPARTMVLGYNETTGARLRRSTDALGRLVQTESSGLDGVPVLQDFSYEWGGLLSSVSRPHVEGDSSQGVVYFTYDARWQVTKVRLPDGTSKEYATGSRNNVLSAYAPERRAEAYVSAVRDAEAHESVAFVDFRGNPVRTVDARGAATRFAYDPFGTLKEITDPAGNKTTLVSDSLGRVIEHVDLDTGTQRFAYSAFDEVVEHIDGAGTEKPRTRIHSFDDVGRLTDVDAPEGRTSFVYDSGPNARGRLTSSLSPAGHSEHYEYQAPPADGNPMANAALLQSVTRRIAGQEYTTTLSYSSTHQLERTEYPASDGRPFAVRYGYDHVGNLLSVTGTASDGSNEDAQFWRREGAYQAQLLETEIFGNDVSSTYDYEDRTGRLKRLTTRSPEGAVLQDLEYLEYWPNGNLGTRRSSFGGANPTQHDEGARYDELGRLQSHVEDTTEQITSYDSIGNITAKGGVGTYVYQQAGKQFRPHAVQAIVRDGKTVSTFGYDDYGNLNHRSGEGVQGGTQNIEYSSFNLPTKVTFGQGAEVTYEYDASDTRVLTRSGDCANPSSPACKERVYAGGAHERETARDANGTFTKHIYKVFAGSRQVAQVERATGRAETRRYLHADHLGSSQVITDESGRAVDIRRFSPSGELRTPPPARHSHTQHPCRLHGPRNRRRNRPR